MAYVFKDRVMETTNTTGTGSPFTLAGAVTGYQAFSAIGDGNVCDYSIWAVDSNGVPTGQWEVNQGTYTLSGTTITRGNPPHASSNSGALVDFAAGTKRIICSPNAQYFFGGQVPIDDNSESADVYPVWATAAGLNGLTKSISTTKLKFKPSTGTLTVTEINGLLTGTSMGFIFLRDEKASNTDGGTFTSGGDRTRTLNREAVDTNGDCTLASNQFTLAAGTYRILAFIPAMACEQHQAWLYNATAAAKVTDCEGSSNYSASASGVQNHSIIAGQFTVAASQALEIQHRCTTTRSNDGFGTKNNRSTPAIEVYAMVFLWRIS